MNFSTFFLDKLNGTDQSLGLGFKKSNSAANGFADIIKICESEASVTELSSFRNTKTSTSPASSEKAILNENISSNSQNDDSELLNMISQFLSNPASPIKLSDLVSSTGSQSVASNPILLSKDELQNFLSDLITKLSKQNPDKTATAKDSGSTKVGNTTSLNAGLLSSLIGSVNEEKSLKISFSNKNKTFAISITPATSQIEALTDSANDPEKMPGLYAITVSEDSKNVLANNSTLITQNEVGDNTSGSLPNSQKENNALPEKGIVQVSSQSIPVKNNNIAEPQTINNAVVDEAMSASQNVEMPDQKFDKSIVTNNTKKNIAANLKVAQAQLQETDDTITNRTSTEAVKVDDSVNGTNQKSIEGSKADTWQDNNSRPTTILEIKLEANSQTDSSSEILKAKVNSPNNSNADIHSLSNELKIEDLKFASSSSKLGLITFEENSQSPVGEKVNTSFVNGSNNNVSEIKDGLGKNNSTFTAAKNNSSISNVNKSYTADASAELSNVSRLFSGNKSVEFCNPNSLQGNKSNKGLQSGISTVASSSDSMNGLTEVSNLFSQRILSNIYSEPLTSNSKIISNDSAASASVTNFINNENTSNNSVNENSKKNSAKDSNPDEQLNNQNNKLDTVNNNQVDLKSNQSDPKNGIAKTEVPTNNEIKNAPVAGLNETKVTSTKNTSSENNSADNNTTFKISDESENVVSVKESQGKFAGDKDSMKQNNDGNNFIQNLNDLKDIAVDKSNNAVDLKNQPDVPKSVKTSELISEFSKFVQNGGDKQSISFQLSPDNLGKVKLIIDLVQNHVNTHIEVENEQVRQFIQQNVQQLKSNLQASGIQLNTVNISLANHEQSTTRQNTTARKYTPKVSRIHEEKSETGKRVKSMGYNTYEFLA